MKEMRAKREWRLLGTLLVGWVTAAGIPTGAMAADELAGEKLASINRCWRDTCLVTALRDSDGDGVSDIDEEAAGTDPHDARSWPGQPKLLGLARDGRLPSLERPFTEIVLLPTTAPDGSPLFGGEASLPGRVDALTKLGITSDLLGTLDAAHGLTLKGVKGGGLAAAALAMGVIRGGGRAEFAAIGMLGNSPSNSPVTKTTTNGSDSLGSGKVTHEDGSVDILGWEVTANGERSAVDFYGPGGEARGTATSSKTTETTNGITTKTTNETVIVAGYQSQKTSVETSAPGKPTVNEWSSETVVSSGNETESVKSSGTVVTGENGETESHSTVVTETCEGDDCTTKVQETENGKPVESTECEASSESCEGVGTGSATAYTDPDYVEATATAMPDLVASVLVMLHSRLDYYEDPRVSSGEPLIPGDDPHDLAPLILVTGDDVDSTTFIDMQGSFWNSHAVKPDVDPNLPNPLLPGGNPSCEAECS